MSAIFGIYHRDQRPVAQEDLENMSQILSHRGTDGANIWAKRNVGLGHRMLWTTAESVHEQLPLVDNSAGLSLTADARLDNRDELYAALELRLPLAEISDSELILAAYIRWGEACPEKLLGDFAFAIWDERNQRLFGARDHFGIKPFYYYWSENSFAFASEIKGVLCLHDVPRRLNEARVAEHLSMVCHDDSITFFEGIRRLPRAHVFTATRDRLSLSSYWALDPLHEESRASDQAYAEEFREIFTKAVKCRLRSAFPIGSMLSGGLDSSAITCVARNLLPASEPLHTFSIVHDVVKECDEREFQNTVLAKGGFVSHYLQNDSVSPLIDLDDLLWHLDEVGGGNLYSNWCLYKQAKEEGVRIILDGFDGDSTVSHGRGYLTELAHAGRWIALLGEVRAFSKKKQLPWKDAYWAWVWSYALEPRIKGSRTLSAARRGYRRGLGKFSQNGNGNKAFIYKSILNPDFVRGNGSASHLPPPPRPPQSEREMHYSLLTNRGMVGSLENLAGASGAFRTEIRFPFWDKRLIEFCLALPANQKWCRGTTRMVMRRAMDGILPSQVQWRPSKANISAAFYHGLLTHEQDRVGQVLFPGSESIEKFVNLKALRQAYDKFTSNQASESEVLAISKVLSLALWLQRTPLTT